MENQEARLSIGLKWMMESQGDQNVVMEKIYESMKELNQDILGQAQYWNIATLEIIFEYQS